MAKIGHTQTTVTVTDSAADILAESDYARNILIQNNDSAGIVYINLSGDATASTTMFCIQPGGSFELLNCPNAISAIGSISSNANIAVTTWV